jgi:hypothetical protein
MALAAGGHDNIGIELVRLSSPPASILKDAEKPRRRGFLGLLVLCFVAAGLGTLAYIAANG